MKRFKQLTLLTTGLTLLGLAAGCGPKEDAPTPGAVSPSVGSAPAATLRDPKVQSDPSVPGYIKDRANGKAGPGQ